MKVCQEFVDLYHSLEALLLTQILINRSVILSTLVENQGQESARLFALPITRDYCRLIFTRQNELTEKQSVDVKVIVRKGRGIVPLTLTLNTPLSLETETEKRDYLIKKLYAETALEAGFILEHFIHKIRQMSRDVTNIDDFCRENVVWFNFFILVLDAKFAFWIWEGAFSLTQSVKDFSSQIEQM